MTTTSPVRTTSRKTLTIIMAVALLVLLTLIIGPWLLRDEGAGSDFSWFSLPMIIILGVTGYGAWKARNDDTVWPQRIFYAACTLVFAWAMSSIVIGPELTKKSAKKIQSTVSETVENLVDDKARVANKKATLAKQRQAEIDQVRHDEKVRVARVQAAAAKPASNDQVVDGCQQLAGIQSGLYDFIQGTEGCRHVTLQVNEYYDAVKGPDINGLRCTRRYPVLKSVSYLDRPGPDRMTNTGNAVEDFAVYFLKKGDRDPVDRTYVCG